MLSLVLLCVVLLLVLALVAPYYWAPARVRRLLDMLPGPRAYPLIGNSLIYWVPREEMLAVRARLLKEYGPVFRTWLLGAPFVSVADPEVIEAIISGTDNVNKGPLMRGLRHWMGNGLLISDDKIWIKRRKQLSSTFSYGIIQGYFPMMNKHSCELVHILAGVTSQPWINLLPHLSLCTLDVICETAMGVCLNTQKGGSKEYINGIRGALELHQQRLHSVWLFNEIPFQMSPLGRKNTKIIRILHDFSNKVIREHTARNAARNLADNEEEKEELGLKKRLSFLEHLLTISDNGKPLTETEIREEVDTFIFGGHDTTAMALERALYCIGRHPDVQAKLVQEQDDIFGGSMRDVTMDDVRLMKYLEHVINESMRMYPVAGVLTREITKDVKVKNYLIPEGSFATIEVFLLHRNSEIYPNPDKFNPDNFLPEVVRNRPAYSFMPFSAGARNCIGQRFAIMEMKVILSHLLRHFVVKSLDEEDDIKLTLAFFMVLKDKLRIKLTPRY